MDSTDNAPSALDAIDSVAFKVGLKGYNVDEVDEFLERLSGEVRQMKDLVHQQRQQLRQAAERIAQLEGGRPAAPAPAPVASRVPAAAAPAPEEVASMIALAQRFIEQAQHEAEEQARDLTVQAQERAKEIVAEARSRAEDEVNRLNGLKQRLGEDVERLSHQLDEQRGRIAGVLAEFTRWVDSAFSGAEQPARPAPRPAPEPPAPVVRDAPPPSTEAVPPPAPGPRRSASAAQPGSAPGPGAHGVPADHRSGAAHG